MKKTLVLSLMLGGAVSLTLSACTKDDQGNDDTTTTTTTTGTMDDVDTTSESTETASTTETTGTDTDGNTDFIIPVGDVPPVEPSCDPFAQDCPEGEKCVPYSNDGSSAWNANKCVPVTGTGVPGDECIWDGIVEATDDCGPDSICWDVMDVDGVNVGVCTGYCEGTADDPICPMGTSCLIANEGSINVCIANCDPLLQDCGDGFACFWAVDSFQCIFTAGDIPTGDPCGYINDCAAGNVCIDATYLPSCDGSACCASWCDTSDPMCPVAGTECVAWFDPGTEPPGYETVGVCILPG